MLSLLANVLPAMAFAAAAAALGEKRRPLASARARVATATCHLPLTALFIFRQPMGGRRGRIPVRLHTRTRPPPAVRPFSFHLLKRLHQTNQSLTKEKNLEQASFSGRPLVQQHTFFLFFCLICVVGKHNQDSRVVPGQSSASYILPPSTRA